MKVKIVSAVIITLTILVVITFIKRDKKSAGKKEICQLDISLSFVQGVDDVPSLLKVRVFSRYLQQKVIDNRFAEKKEKIVPIEVTCPKSVWEKELYLMVSKNEDSGYKKIEKGIKPVKMPDETKLIISPETVYLIMYELTPDIKIKEGSRICVEAEIGGYKLKSNYVEVPSTPLNEKEKLLQKAKIAMYSGNNKELLQVSEKMIAENKDDPSGYWYKGIALENEKDYKQALAAYETTLEKYPKPSQNDNQYEPPMRLVEKIRELKKIGEH